MYIPNTYDDVYFNVDGEYVSISIQPYVIDSFNVPYVLHQKVSKIRSIYYYHLGQFSK